MGERSEHIAVVGGGIAGVSAAWSLHKAGYGVSIFEAGPELGGNAKTYDWPVPDGVAESPLLVFAWPEQYYHNYKALLRTLGVGTRPMPNSYFVSAPEGTFAQEPHGAIHERFSREFGRWGRLVRFINRVNGWFLPKERGDSLYHSSYLNPMNLIPLYWLARIFGVSRAFWKTIFVTVHCASFITKKMSRVPAVIAPLLESIVPLGEPSVLETWSTPPREVFARLTSEFADNVHVEHRIVRVTKNERYTIEDAQGRTYEADKVVFACNSISALESLSTPTCLQKALLGNVRYVDDDDNTFSDFVIHTDPSVLPEDHRERILSDFNTYVAIDNKGDLAPTFVLSSNYPGLSKHGVPMLVSFNYDKEPANVLTRGSLRRVAHSVSIRNLTIMSLMRHVQGQNDIYFCGSFTTPEGGHDLSCLSGMVVANMIGAPYPLPADNALAVADFDRMGAMMLGARHRR